MDAAQTFLSACACSLKADEYEKRGCHKIAAFARERARELLEEAILKGTGWTPA